MRGNKLIQFYLTNMCNSRCFTCGIWKNVVKEELDILNVQEVLFKYPKADFVFGGGESTLYSDIDELLYFSNMCDINYTMLTNAVSYGRLSDILDNHRVNNLTISCDGEKHDYIRGVDGNLKNILRIIDVYRDKIPNIKLSYTYSKLNEDNFENDMKFFKEIGFDKIYFCLAQDMDLLKVNEDKIIAEDIKPILRHLDMLYDKDASFIKRLADDNIGRCDSVGTVHTIYSNGDVVLCQSYMSKMVIGNIYKDIIETIFKDTERNYLCKYNDVCNLVCQRRYD